jgi:hypothetical protein
LTSWWWAQQYSKHVEEYTVIRRLTKIIRSGITFVSRNVNCPEHWRPVTPRRSVTLQEENGSSETLLWELKNFLVDVLCVRQKEWRGSNMVHIAPSTPEYLWRIIRRIVLSSETSRVIEKIIYILATCCPSDKQLRLLRLSSHCL